MNYQNRMIRLTTAWFCLCLGLLLLSGCPASGLHNNIFYKGNIKYKIGDLGEDWRPIEISENDIAYYNSSFSAIIQINSTCRSDYEDVSLSILLGHLLYGLTDRKVIREEKRMIDNRDALYTELNANLDGVSIQAALLVLKKNECIYDFAYMTRPWNFGRGIGDFHRLIYGFRVLS
jgi:hypothetical protein